MLPLSSDTKAVNKRQRHQENSDGDVEHNVLGCRLTYYFLLLGANCDHCVYMVQCCFTSTETIKVIRTGSPGRPPRLPHSPELWRKIGRAQQWLPAEEGNLGSYNFSSIFSDFQNFLPYHIFLESLWWHPWHRLFLHTSSWCCFAFSSSNLHNLERPGFSAFLFTMWLRLSVMWLTRITWNLHSLKPKRHAYKLVHA